MAREIRMSFDLFGNSKLDAVGFVGTTCEDATKQYLTVLNAKSQEDTKKPEYSQPANVGQTVGARW